MFMTQAAHLLHIALPPRGRERLRSRGWRRQLEQVQAHRCGTPPTVSASLTVEVGLTACVTPVGTVPPVDEDAFRYVWLPSLRTTGAVVFLSSPLFG